MLECLGFGQWDHFELVFVFFHYIPIIFQCLLRVWHTRIFTADVAASRARAGTSLMSPWVEGEHGLYKVLPQLS